METSIQPSVQFKKPDSCDLLKQAFWENFLKSSQVLDQGGGHLFTHILP